MVENLVLSPQGGYVRRRWAKLPQLCPTNRLLSKAPKPGNDTEILSESLSTGASIIQNTEIKGLNKDPHQHFSQRRMAGSMFML